ncbi:G2/mitotic-specific cyclin-B3 isoform X1 [Podarcis muralis]
MPKARLAIAALRATPLELFSVLLDHALFQGAQLLPGLSSRDSPALFLWGDWLLVGKMPRPRNFVPSQVDGATAGADNAEAEQELSSLAKRPQPLGACRKRPAFGDMTNAHKSLKKQGKKEVAKKASEITTLPQVTESDRHVVKKSLSKAASEEAPPNSDQFAKKGPIQDKEEEMDHSLTSVDQVASALNPTCSETMEVMPVDNNGQPGEPYTNCEYALDIFMYMREREERYLLPDYMKDQPDITTDMRAILVDWMVEVQENFELNHETLYLAVKLLDHFLAKETTMRDRLQLIGSTAILVAAKFEERCKPCVDDFLYICDDAYDRKALLCTEKSILIALKYDINIPIAYRFLRQYAKCAQVNMETLTLARFICELTLQDYDFVQESASQLASACLFLALRMKELGGWGPTLERYSGYKDKELYPLVKKLNFMLTYKHDERLNTVHSKYSHRVFFEVAKIPPINMRKLEEALQS